MYVWLQIIIPGVSSSMNIERLNWTQEHILSLLEYKIHIKFRIVIYIYIGILSEANCGYNVSRRLRNRIYVCTRLRTWGSSLIADPYLPDIYKTLSYIIPLLIFLENYYRVYCVSNQNSFILNFYLSVPFYVDHFESIGQI